MGKYLAENEIGIWVGRRRETEAGEALELFPSFASPGFTKELRRNKFSNLNFAKKGAQASTDGVLTNLLVKKLFRNNVQI